MAKKKEEKEEVVVEEKKEEEELKRGEFICGVCGEKGKASLAIQETIGGGIELICRKCYVNQNPHRKKKK
jgi:hypothetical protein